MRMTYLDAAREALAEEMRRDPMVWAVGEDLGRGGVFGQYRGLVEEFGPERISDAPISEAAITGVAIGAAQSGLRPVLEIMFIDFITLALDQLVNGAAQASNSALVTGAAEMKWLNGWTTAATFEGEFSNVTRTYAGKGVARYQW